MDFNDKKDSNPELESLMIELEIGYLWTLENN